MNERIIEFYVGLMVLATLLITAILVVLFGEMPTFMQKTYTIRVKFTQAPGVTQDTPVRKSGILIGRVSDVRFADDGGVLVVADIHRDVPLRRNEVVRIGGSLFGEADLQFVPSPVPTTSSEPIQPDEILMGEAPVNAMDLMANAQQDFAQMQKSFSQTMVVAAETGEEMKRAAQEMANLLDANERRVQVVLDQAAKTLESIGGVADNIQNLTGDPEVQGNLKAALAELPTLLQETRQTVQGIQEAVTVAKASLEDVRQVTEPLGQRAGPFLARIDGSADKLDRLVDELYVFSQKLNNPDSSLGQLVQDRELYDNINDTVANLREISVQARPIVSDVRVFTDKIARHPELLGVRGAIEKNTGLK